MKKKMPQSRITEYFQRQKPKGGVKSEKSYRKVTVTDKFELEECSSGVETVESPKSDVQNLPREKSKDKQARYLGSVPLKKVEEDLDESSMDSDSMTDDDYSLERLEGDDSDTFDFDQDDMNYMEASQGSYQNPWHTSDLEKLVKMIISETEDEIRLVIDVMMDRISVWPCNSKSHEKRADLIDAFIASVQKQCTLLQKLYGKKLPEKSTGNECLNSNLNENASKNSTPHSLGNELSNFNLNGNASTSHSGGNERFNYNFSGNTSKKSKFYSLTKESVKENAVKKSTPFFGGNECYSSSFHGNTSQKSTSRSLRNVHPPNTSYYYPYINYSYINDSSIYSYCSNNYPYTSQLPTPSSSYSPEMDSMIQMPDLAQTLKNLHLAEESKRYQQYVANNSGSHNYYYETI